MPLFPSEAWFREYGEQVNSSGAYAEAASAWEGDVTLVVKAQPDAGLSRDVYAWLDLWHGKCREVRYDVEAEEGERAKFLIRAPYRRWKQVIRGELDPIKGMMQGKLKLKGDLSTIVRFINAAHELVNLAGRVPTQFGDELR
ncbi:MAG: SCP2 sterol-binding domain-containing protein [Actinomycetota bacterium]